MLATKINHNSSSNDIYKIYNLIHEYDKLLKKDALSIVSVGSENGCGEVIIDEKSISKTRSNADRELCLINAIKYNIKKNGWCCNKDLDGPKPAFTIHFANKPETIMFKTPIICTAKVTKNMFSIWNRNRITAPRSHLFRSKRHHDVVSDDVDINLALLEDGNFENSIVWFLFKLLNDLSLLLEDKFGTDQCFAYDKYDRSYMNQKSFALPSSLRLNVQVKSVYAKCKTFLGEMYMIASKNKVFDKLLYSECEQSLNQLKVKIAFLGPFQNWNAAYANEIEEKYMEGAQHLAQILQQLCDLVANLNYKIHIFDWAVKIKREFLSDNNNITDYSNYNTLNYIKRHVISINALTQCGNVQDYDFATNLAGLQMRTVIGAATEEDFITSYVAINKKEVQRNQKNFAINVPNSAQNSTNYFDASHIVHENISRLQNKNKDVELQTHRALSCAYLQNTLFDNAENLNNFKQNTTFAGPQANEKVVPRYVANMPLVVCDTSSNNSLDMWQQTSNRSQSAGEIVQFETNQYDEIAKVWNSQGVLSTKSQTLIQPNKNRSFSQQRSMPLHVSATSRANLIALNDELDLVKKSSGRGCVHNNDFKTIQQVNTPLSISNNSRQYLTDLCQEMNNIDVPISQEPLPRWRQNLRCTSNYNEAAAQFVSKNQQIGDVNKNLEMTSKQIDGAITFERRLHKPTGNNEMNKIATKFLSNNEAHDVAIGYSKNANEIKQYLLFAKPDNAVCQLSQIQNENQVKAECFGNQMLQDVRANWNNIGRENTDSTPFGRSHSSENHFDDFKNMCNNNNVMHKVNADRSNLLHTQNTNICNVANIWSDNKATEQGVSLANNNQQLHVTQQPLAASAPNANAQSIINTTEAGYQSGMYPHNSLRYMRY
ncbi:uncharacterized protein LOC119685713 [Teleopsis dalmanni]|uniref:uncharacterized protein LOC119685713 n=1 Tax=Teleopsis dalmanni TaxID=139649 RepID=UPI0018CDB7E9|nr:uncharacterized protein LOC119685713 [Teleopsis dalmanni]